MTTDLMSTFHTQQQSLSHLASTRMKENPLKKKNAIFPHTQTKKLAYLSIFR